MLFLSILWKFCVFLAIKARRHEQIVNKHGAIHAIGIYGLAIVNAYAGW